jgi:hypothetical protein
VARVPSTRTTPALAEMASQPRQVRRSGPVSMDAVATADQISQRRSGVVSRSRMPSRKMRSAVSRSMTCEAM